MSCVDAARARMRHVYDTFDTVCVQFSGGKDSTAVLYLAKEIHEERKLGPVKVIFRDEEMVSPSVIKFMEEVRNYDWVDMEWYCLPQGQEIWSLGRREYCLLWSEQRRKDAGQKGAGCFRYGSKSQRVNDEIPVMRTEIARKLHCHAL